MEAGLSLPCSHRAAGRYNPELKAIYFAIACWLVHKMLKLSSERAVAAAGLE